MINVLKRIDRKVFAILLTAGLLGVVAILPYAVELVANLPISRAATDMPLTVIVLLALLQNGILFAVVIVIGMILSERIGLRMPLIRAWASGQPAPNAKAIVLPGIIVGVAIGIALVTLEALFFLHHLPSSMQTLFAIPLWKRLLSGVLYGGVTEEILMRLFLLSTVAWLLARWWKTPEGMPSPGAFWTAIILTALLFGLGHLPTTAAIVPLTQALVVRALVLNGVAGVAFGYLYWRHGLEAAMVAHASAHLVMQIPGMMLLKEML